LHNLPLLLPRPGSRVRAPCCARGVGRWRQPGQSAADGASPSHRFARSQAAAASHDADGVLTARAVAFARRLSARAFVPGAHQPAQLLEVYPRATLHQHGSAEPSLGPRAPNEPKEAYAARVVDRFEARIDGITPYRPRLVQREHHVLDALVAAFTGWLSPRGLEQPPPGFNTSTGWIWFPKVDAIPADAS